MRPCASNVPRNRKKATGVERGFSMPSTEKALDRWGRNLERAEAKAEPSHSILLYLPPFLRYVGSRRRSLFSFEGNRLQQRSLLVVELDCVAACPQDRIATIVAEFAADEVAVLHQHRLDDVGGGGQANSARVAATKSWIDVSMLLSFGRL